MVLAGGQILGKFRVKKEAPNPTHEKPSQGILLSKAQTTAVANARCVGVSGWSLRG